jgi:putative sterol carrier protein
MAEGFQSKAVFASIAELLKKDPEVAKKTPAVFAFVITKGPGGASAHWTVDMKAGEVRAEKPAKADCTMTLSDEDFVAMVSGKLAAQRAFMTGKLKIGGNMTLAQKFAAVTAKLSKATSKL